MFNQNGLLQHVMQAWVRYFERKDKQAQTVFLGNQTKDHFSSREGPILLWSSFLVSLHFHFNPFFPLGFFSIHFSSTFFWVLFFQHFCFCSFSYFPQSGLNTFCNSNFPHLPSSIRHLIAYSARGDFFSLLPPMWRVILGRDIEENLSGSKRVTMDNFSISVKG